MSDNIVTKLRDLREVLMGNPIMAREVQEAMDEINHLRNKLEQFHNILDIYNETCECDGCAACCQYELVVRGE